MHVTVMTSPMPHLLSLTALLTLATASAALAQNDECTAAIALTIDVPMPFDTSIGTLSAPPWTCFSSTAPDLWYRMTPHFNGSLLIELCGSGFDTNLEVFSGTCGALSLERCNNNSCGLASRVEIDVTAGTTYICRVGGFGAAQGTGTITAILTPYAGPNDHCVGAMPLALDTPILFDTTGASPSSPAWPCAGNGGRDLWYSHTAAATGDLRVTTCGASYDSALEVFTGDCAGLVSVACNDDACATQAEIVFAATAGTTYLIRVGGANNATGSGPLWIEVQPPPALHIVGHLPATWIDISGTGTPLSLDDDGEVDVVTTLGNTLFPAGVVRIGSNGGVRFNGAGLDLVGANAVISAGSAFGGDQTLLPFWDDLDTSSGMVGEIYVGEAQGRLVVQWQDVGFAGQPTTERATFQVQVPASGPALAQFLYQDVSGARAHEGGSATIGYQAGGIENDVEWSFDQPGAVVDGSVLTLLPVGAGGVGTSYCPANPNSTGQTARIVGAGSASVASNDLTLAVDRLPDHTFGYFITGPEQIFLPNPLGSQGNLCIGGQIGRYVGPGEIKNSGVTGAFSLLVDLTQTPTPTGFVSVTVGETRYFQVWHRDAIGGVTTSNFTNGLAVTFI
jgi:hypothetical protein